MQDETERNRSDLLAPELTDADVYDAMGRLPGYLDITTDDFRELYRLAYGHAMDRLVGDLRASDLMRTGETALTPGQSLAEAVGTLAEGGLKSMPVADGDGRVVGVLSETDVLRFLGAATFAELIHRPPQRLAELDALLQTAAVGAVMTSPAVTVGAEAGFADIMRAFRAHGGRRMPVADAEGRLVGVLARKDFVAACPLGPGV